MAYALRITEIDPLKYDLLFERFLNPDRISMPDMDIDIQDSRRDEVINYCIEKYGSDRVANIVTFGRMARPQLRARRRPGVASALCRSRPPGQNDSAADPGPPHIPLKNLLKKTPT